MIHLKYANWKYKNTALLAASVLLLLIFADHALVRGFIAGIGGLGYVGLFFAGFFVVSTFTIVPATIVLAEMSDTFTYWEMTAVVTLGIILGDYVMFRFIRDTISEELKPLLDYIGEEKHVRRLFHSPLFGWLTPVIGAVIIASPLPDEIGLGIMGMQHMSTPRFLALVSVINFIGAMLLVSLLKSFA